MPAITSILLGVGLAAGVGLGAAGYMQQKSAASQMQQAQQQEIAQQQAIEKQRQQQMELEYQRQQKQVLRNSIRARAMSLATSTNQGANFGSALMGAYGQESGQYNTQALAANQNYDIGQNIFGINAQMSNSRMAYANAQSQYQAGGALSSLGGMFVQNAQQISRVGATGLKYATGQVFGTNPEMGSPYYSTNWG